MSIVSRSLLLAVILIAALCISPVVAVATESCAWASVNDIEFADYLSGAEGNVKNAPAIHALIADLRALADRSFYTYSEASSGSFLASDGTILAANQPRVQAVWQQQQWYAFGIDREQAIEWTDDQGVLHIDYFDEQVTLHIATHPAQPDKAYWFLTPEFNAGNDHPNCGAFETDLQTARDWMDRVSSIPLTIR